MKLLKNFFKDREGTDIRLHKIDLALRQTFDIVLNTRAAGIINDQDPVARSKIRRDIETDEPQSASHEDPFIFYLF